MPLSKGPQLTHVTRVQSKIDKEFVYRKMKGRKNRITSVWEVKFCSKWSPLWTSPTSIGLQHIRSYMKQKFDSLTRQHMSFWVSWLTYNILKENVGTRRTFSRKRWAEILTDDMWVTIAISPSGSSTTLCLTNVLVVSRVKECTMLFVASVSISHVSLPYACLLTTSFFFFFFFFFFGKISNASNHNWNQDYESSAKKENYLP